MRSSDQHRRPSLLAGALSLAVLVAAPLLAQTPIDPPTLVIQADDAVSQDQFGDTVDADGPVLLVVAPNDRDAGYAAGALYIFERDGSSLAWDQVLEIVPQGSFHKIAAGAVSGDTFAYVDTSSEELHIYERDTLGAWQPAAVFVDPSDYDFEDLVLDGDDLFVKARLGSGPMPYKLNHYQRGAGVWQLVDESLAFFPNHAGFALEGDVLVYGRRIAERDALTGTFVEVADLLIPAGAADHPNDGFGDSAAVAPSGTRVAFGSTLDSIDGTGSGSAYVFDRDAGGQWNLAERLAPTDAQADRRFGAALDFTADRLVVLATGSNSAGVPGGGYVFDPDTSGQLVEVLRLAPGSGRIPGGLAVTPDVAFLGDSTSDGLAPGGAVAVFPFVATTPPPQVSIDPLAQCPASSLISVTGSVSDEDPIARLASTVDGGPETVLCTDCGLDPSFAFDATLLACQDNLVEVTAEDSEGQTGRGAASVYFDDIDPSILGCEDQVILIEEGEFYADAAEPTASDNCELVAFECLNQTDFFWPRFPIGADQPASCYALDRCGREARCDFTVTVEVETDDGCEVFDYRDEVGGGPGGLPGVVLGDGQTASAELTDSGVEVRSFGSVLGPEGDNGGFRYKEVSGAFRVETPVPSLSDFAEDPKGGLMVRWGFDTLSARAMAVRRPADGTIEFGVRTAAGQLGQPLASTISAAGVTHLALEWQGGEIRVEYSTDDGATWITPSGGLGGSATVATGGLQATAGFVVSSQSDEIIVGLTGGGAATKASRQAATKAGGFDDASFIFPYLKLCALEEEPPAPPTGGCVEDDFEDGAVGPEWTLAGLGNANQVSVLETGGVLELTADGATAFAGADNAGFLYQSFEGDFRAEVTVDGRAMTTGGALRKAGLMVRSSVDSLAPRLFANLLPFWNNSATETHLQFVARETQGGPGNVAVATDVVGVPRTVRLAIERSGNDFTVQYSTDGGVTWTTPGGGLGGTVNLAMPGTVLVGLDVVSNDISVTSTARFDDFEICAPCEVDDFEDGVIDPAWTLVGVGNANQESALETGGVLELTADGATAFTGADNAGFLYREVVGDFRAEVTIDGRAMVTGGLYRKAGLMVRESLDNYAVRLLAQLAPFWNNQDETHLQFVAREVQGGPGNLAVATDVVGVPRTVRLAVVRQGDTLSVEYSTDGGVTFLQPSTGLGGSITIPGLAPTLLVGLDMVSNNISVTSTARFDDFELCAP